MKSAILLEAKDIQCPTHAYLKTSGGSRDDSTMTDDIEFCHCENDLDTRRVPEDGWTIEKNTNKPVAGQACCERPDNAMWLSNRPMRVRSTADPVKAGCENQWTCNPGYTKTNEACEACPAAAKPEDAHWFSYTNDLKNGIECQWECDVGYSHSRSSYTSPNLNSTLKITPIGGRKSVCKPCNKPEHSKWVSTIPLNDDVSQSFGDLSDEMFDTSGADGTQIHHELVLDYDERKRYPLCHWDCEPGYKRARYEKGQSGDWFSEKSHYCTPCTGLPENAHWTSTKRTRRDTWAIGRVTISKDVCTWQCDAGFVEKDEACHSIPETDTGVTETDTGVIQQIPE